MKRAIYHLEDRQLGALAELVGATNRPAAEFVRDALDLYLPFVTPDSKAHEVLTLARVTFADSITDPAVLSRALFAWMYNREQNSKRGALVRIEAGVNRIDAKIDTLFGYPSALAEMVAALQRAEEAGFDWNVHGDCVIEAIQERMKGGEW